MKSILLLLFLAALTRGLAPPKCEIGYGLVDPTQDAYGSAKEGDCKKCAVPNCQYCLQDYQKCKDVVGDYVFYGCKPGYGLNGKEDKCLKCAGSNCGVCDNNYKKCTRKVAKCNGKIKKVRSATKVKVDEIKGEGNESCFGEPYHAGTGYVSRFVPLVKNGVCIDCNSNNWYTRDVKRDFCWVDGVMKQVAANAFKEKKGCKYPQDIKLKLLNTCANNNRSTLDFFKRIIMDYHSPVLTF